MAKEVRHDNEGDQKDATLGKLRKLLDRLENPDREESKAKAFFNSAFIVTVLGGVLVAFIGWGLQVMTSHHEKEMLEAKQTRESKEKVAFDFANSFPLTLDLASRVRKRSLWLEAQEKKRTKEPYYDGRSFEETRNYYETCLDQYLARPPLASSYNQVIAVFTNGLVIQYATNLFGSFNILLGATNRDQVDRTFDECDVAYRQLTKYMFEEVLMAK